MDVLASAGVSEILPDARCASDDQPEVWFPVQPGPRFVVIDRHRAVSEPTVSSVVPGGSVSGPGSSPLRRSSAAEGTRVHEAVAIDLCGQRVNPRWEEYAHQARAFLEHSGGAVIAVEVPVFTPGRYGGFLDCLAVRPNGQLMAIDWKTGKVTASDAVRLAAYTSAEQRLVTEASTVVGPGPDGDLVYTGRSYPTSRTQITRAWIVQLAPGRCRAFGFDPNDQPEPPQYHALERLLDPDDDAPPTISRWWKWEWDPNNGLTYQPPLL